MAVIVTCVVIAMAVAVVAVLVAYWAVSWLCRRNEDSGDINDVGLEILYCAPTFDPSADAVD